MNKKTRSNAVNKQEDEDFSVYPLYGSRDHLYAMENQQNHSMPTTPSFQNRIVNNNEAMTLETT